MNIYLKAIPDARMLRGMSIPTWCLLLAVLGILSKCESLRTLERFAWRHQDVLTDMLNSAALGSPLAQDC